MSTSDLLSIAGVSFTSRLFIGTARYPNLRVMADAVAGFRARDWPTGLPTFWVNPPSLIWRNGG